jgi:hypothetical protein
LKKRFHLRGTWPAWKADEVVARIGACLVDVTQPTAKKGAGGQCLFLKRRASIRGM